MERNPANEANHGKPAGNNNKADIGKNNDASGAEQAGGITDKRDMNAGSGAFNQGSAQDPDFDRGAADQTPEPDKVSREKENPKTPLRDDQV